MKSTSEIRVLHVDDDRNFIDVAKTILSDEGPFVIDAATSTDEALTKLQENKFDVIISDYDMPQKDGLNFLKQLREKGVTTPFVLFTGKGREEIVVQALNMGVDRYINKHGDPQTVYTELSVAIRQLHEKTLAQNMLWESEERFKQMVTHNKDLIMLTGNDGKILYLSPSCKDVLGYEPNELVGKIPGIIHPDDSKYAQKVFQAALTTESRESIEYRIITKQGQTKWVDHSFSQIMENGKVKQIVSTVKDTTEAKLAQEKLIESEERFRLLIENSPVMMAHLDRDLRYIWVHNPQLRPNLSEKVLGNRFGEQVDIENINQVLQDLQKLIKTGGSIRKEITLHDDRGTIYLDCHFEASLNTQGKISGLRFTAYDITERKKMLNQLRDLEERWNFALEGAGQGVWDYNASNKKLFLSKKWKEIIGYKEDDLGNDSSEWKTRLHPDDKEKSIQEIEGFLTSKKDSYKQEYRLLAKDGSYKWIFSQGRAINRSEDGTALRVIGTILDITERKESEIALKESENKFSASFYSSGAALAISRLDNGLILEVNDSFLKIFGYTREEVIGKTPQELNLYANISDRQEIINLTLKDQPVINREVKGVKKDKSEVTVLFSTKAFYLKGQKHLLTTLIDITNLKKVEETLFLRQKELETFFDLAPDALIVGDLTGKIIECNEMAFKAFGFNKNELVGSNGLMFLSEPTKSVLVEKFTKAIADDKRAINSVFTGRYKNGKDVCVEASVKLTYDQQKIPTGFIAIIRDITERKLTEQKLQESEERYRVMAEYAQDLITVTDVDGNIIFVSPSIKRLAGYTPDEIVGKKTVMECIHKDDLPLLTPTVQESLETNGPAKVEMRYLTKEGKTIWLESNISPVKDSTGNIKFITISRDVTQRRIDSEERMKALEWADLLLTKLSVVGGFVRHDVRNKLTVIQSTLYLGKKYSDNPFMLKQLEMISHSVENIGRILDFAQTYEAAGSQGLSWFNVNRAINEAKLMCPDLNALEIKTENVNFEALADSALIEIFHNLIDNSIKYGKGLTKIHVYSQKSQNGNLQLIYEDNGGGIDPQTKTRLFLKGVGKGTGLGLYLIQRICEIYGWQVSESGEYGKGVRFVIEIPQGKSRKKPK